MFCSTCSGFANPNDVIPPPPPAGLRKLEWVWIDELGCCVTLGCCCGTVVVGGVAALPEVISWVGGAGGGAGTGGGGCCISLGMAVVTGGERCV